MVFDIQIQGLILFKKIININIVWRRNYGSLGYKSVFE